MEGVRWRVAVTHDDTDRSVYAALERAAFVAVSCPVMIEAAAPPRPAPPGPPPKRRLLGA